MRILGIDPGTATTGYGLIEAGRRKSPRLLQFGWIKTQRNGEPGSRLSLIYKEMLSLLRHHKPEVVAIERLFFYANAKTAMSVAQAHGVLLLSCARAKIPVVEYVPMQIKRIVVGNGRADKDAMKKVIRKVFNVRSPNKKKTHFDDVADALAVALCHAVKGGEVSHARV